MIKFNFVMLVLLLLWQYAAAQINLSGTVYDAYSHQSVPFATVALDGYPSGTCTNKQGHFWLTLPKQAEGELVISSLGYQPLRIAMPKNDTAMSIALLPRAYTIKAVTVSGKSQSAKRLLKTAMKNIPDHYRREAVNIARELTVTHKRGDEMLLSGSTQLKMNEPGYKDGPIYSMYEPVVEKIITSEDTIPSIPDEVFGFTVIRLLNVLKNPLDMLKINPARYEHWSTKDYHEYDYRFSNDTVINKQSCYVIESTLRDSLFHGTKYLNKEYFFVAKKREALVHYKRVTYSCKKAEPQNSYELLDDFTVSFTQTKEGFIADEYKFEGYIRQERIQGSPLIVSSFIVLK